MLDNELKKVASNALYLLCTQGVAYIAPIIILGHLITTLGMDGFGKYAFALVIMAYFQVIIDYGFAFSSSKKVSQNRSNVIEISKVYYSTTLIKLIFGGALFPVFYYTCTFFIHDKLFLAAIASALLWGVSNSLYPVWFFQGVENLKPIAVINVVSRILSCLSVVIFVRDESNINIAVLVQLIPVMIGGGVANYIIIRKYISQCFPDKHYILESVKHGWDFFVATLASTLLTNSAVFILGVFYSPSVVGTYAAVERIVKAVVSLFAPITQALYPYNCRKFLESFNSGLSAAKRTGQPLVFLSFIVCALIIFCWPLIYPRMNLSGDSYIYVILLAPWFVCGVLNNVLGIQILSAAGYSKKYSQCFAFAALVTIIMLVILAWFEKTRGAALAVSFGEMLLCVLLFINVNRIKSNHQFKEITK